jgi:DNA end-binding protein Ku
MAARSSWEGFLKLSLISVPVRAYNAAVPGGGDIHFHQIHGKCGNRIHYKKVCPIHGEVTKDEIVSGYEFKKDKYVEFDKEELEKLRSPDEKAINIEAFVSPGQIAPTHLSGRTFYLVPAGPAGQKSYSLLRDVMAQKNRCAIATIVMSGHDEAVLIRPEAKMLTMTMLYRDDQIKNPSAFQDEVKSVKATPQESKLAAILVDESTPKDFDFAQLKDQFTERVSHAIDAKLKGKDLSAEPHKKAPRVINLMDALRKSLDHARKATTKPSGTPGRSKRKRSA